LNQTKIGICVGVADVISHTNFGNDRSIMGAGTFPKVVRPERALGAEGGKVWGGVSPSLAD